jgi:hypothetical protein
VATALVTTADPANPLSGILATAAVLPDVRAEVAANHDDNRWWPRRITDWRLRMTLACWSARVSYGMINRYAALVDRVESIGYEALTAAPDQQVLDLLQTIGLQHSRLRVFRSLSQQIHHWKVGNVNPVELSNDGLVETIVTSVDGAGYKLAQCAALYAKGYHCGIIPVDSGMADMLGPCLGLKLPRGGYRHEAMRKKLEAEVLQQPNAFRALPGATGYSQLIRVPVDQPPTWWVHLVLVYFKRSYCNRMSPEGCPFRPALPAIGRMCEPRAKQRRPGAYWASFRTSDTL